MCEGRGWGEGGGWVWWRGMGRHRCDGSGRRRRQHVEEWPAVRSIVVARRGGGGGTRQGVVRVARNGAGDESLSSMGHVTPVTPA